MAKKVSLINMKGGVGKSTLAVNLAWYFASNLDFRKRVLVIDLDPQCSASRYLLRDTDYERCLSIGKPTTWEIFEQKPFSLHNATTHIDSYSYPYDKPTGVLNLIPSRRELADCLKDFAQKAERLSKIVSQIEHDYDLILIDCAPMESGLTIAAYLASDYLLTPVKPEFLSSEGLPLLANSIQNFKDHYGKPSLEMTGVVFNMVPNQGPEEGIAKSKVREIAKRNKWHVFQTEVPFSFSFPTSSRERTQLAHASSVKRKTIDQFNLFAEEFAERIELRS